MDIQLIGEIFGILLAIGIGLGCGSYATMPYYRLPTGESCAGKWIGKKSHCTSCDHQLRTRDLVPVFNWLLTRGKCQFCGYKISPVYFFIEFTITILSVLIFLRFGVEHLNLYIMVLGLAVCLVIAVATDFSYRKIPDPVLVVAVMFGFLYNSPEQFNDMINVFVLAVLVGLGYSQLYKKNTKKDLESYRYLKLIAIAGIWLDFTGFIIFLSLSALLCLVISDISKARKESKEFLFLAPAFAIPLIGVILYL